jgi:hypothetical protein
MSSWADDDDSGDEPTLIWKSSENVVRPPTSTTAAKPKAAAAPAAVAEPTTKQQQSTNAIVGTSVVMERSYVRGTPTASQVRTVETLESWFQLLMRKVSRDKKKIDYVLDQLKAIRQDITVQHLETPFAVRVYSENARLALEHGDEAESRLCFARAAELTKQLGLTAQLDTGSAPAAAALASVFEQEPANAGLRVLQALGDGGMSAIALLSTPVPGDYSALAQRLQVVGAPSAQTLLLVHLRAAGARGCATSASCANLCSAVLLLNYVQFFAELRLADSLVQKAAAKLAARFRIDALTTILHAYSPSIAVSALQRDLGFASDAECQAFLRNELSGIVFADGSEQKPIESATARLFVVTKSSRAFQVK